MQGKIGRAEFFSLALVLCLSGVLLLGAVEKAAGPLAWLLLVAALPVGLLCWLIFYFWLKLYAGQSFGASLEYAFGRAAGRMVLFAYALFWLLLAESFGGCVAAFWSSLGANNLPLWFYTALFLLVVACFAATGGTALARVALLVVVPALFLTLVNLWLTVWNADFGNLLPLLPVHTAKGPAATLIWLRQGLYYGLLVFGGFSALLPVLQHTSEVKKRLGALGAALATAFLLWLVLALGSQVVLGASLPLYEFPILQVFRLAEFGHWFSRFEVIGAVLLVMLALLRAAALFGAAVSSLLELWGVHPQQRGCIWLISLGCWLLLMILYWVNRYYAPLGEILLALCGWMMIVFSLLLPILAVIFGAIKFKKEHKNIVIRHDQY